MPAVANMSQVIPNHVLRVGPDRPTEHVSEVDELESESESNPRLPSPFSDPRARSVPGQPQPGSSSNWIRQDLLSRGGPVPLRLGPPELLP
ncbi:unnamed protein product [Arctogadus glacialis]